METLLFPDPATQQEFRKFYLRKYKDRKPDVIITVGPSPLRFMQSAHESAFAGTPVIFCLPLGNAPGFRNASTIPKTGAADAAVIIGTVSVALMKCLPVVSRLTDVTSTTVFFGKCRRRSRRSGRTKSVT